MSLVYPSVRAPGDLITAAIWNQDVVANVIALLGGGLEFLIDGGDAVPSAGLATGCLEVPFNCTITAVRLFSNVAGTIEVDIWAEDYANYPPAVADSICAAALPILSGASKYQDTTLTSWTTGLVAGDVLYFNVEASPAPATLVWCLVSLRIQRA